MKTLFSTALVTLFVSASALAHGIDSAATKAVKPDFDIVKTGISTEGNLAVFSMQVSGKAGKTKPEKSGSTPGARVYSYVWPTSMDTSAVGFESKSGILAFAVTIHPDFNDTPLFENDGAKWHSHWVVLVPDEACGPKALKVKDIAEGTKPKLPKTWPGLPIFIDSPGYVPQFAGATVSVKVPFDDIAAVKSSTFDGVTSGLRVNANLHAPFLCIENVFKVASGNLSLPGKVN
jgi:hypothetical protein